MLTKIIALAIGAALVIGRIIALAAPKTQQRMWKKIAGRPDCSVRRMGTVFLIAGAFLIIFSAETADASTIVALVAAGWFLFLGSYAFAVKPLKAALTAFPKAEKRAIWAANAIAFLLGLAIIYLVLG